MLILCLSLLLSFLQIGLFGWGGPFALLSYVQHEVVVEHGWLTSAEFADVMALSRVLPGDVALDAAPLAAYRVLAGEYGTGAAIGGIVVAFTALAVPAFALSALMGRFRERLCSSDVGESILSLLRPMSPGLIAAAAILLMNADNFGSPAINPWQFGVSLFLFVATLVGSGYYRFHPLFMIVLCGLAGLLLY